MKIKLLWCWRCGYKRYEWTRWKKFREDRGRCFYCRIDALDKRYGPSEAAELWRLCSKQKDYRPRAGLTRWERWKLLHDHN